MTVKLGPADNENAESVSADIESEMKIELIKKSNREVRK
jgi:hypothetical protein